MMNFKITLLRTTVDRLLKRSRNMRIVKMVIVFFIFGIAIILAIMGLYALIHGSLEMTPTMEQQEKARIAGAVLLLFGFFMAFIGRLLCRKK